MERLRTQVQRLGPHFRTVLLRGEAGTGKQMVARALHSLSSHAAGPFVVLDAAATRGHLAAGIDGHVKQAHRGTLYIHQVGELSYAGQTGLLEELQRRQRGRGRIVVHGLEGRIIASTTENLRGLAASGRFLDELYTRLTTLEIELPPLRKRSEDIPLLADCFVSMYARHYGKQVDGISAEAMQQLQAYPWPGNAGQLKELLRDAVAESRGGKIEAEDIAIPSETGPAEVAAPGTAARLQEVVEQHVCQVLKMCSGNKVRAAEMLGISRSTLYRMLDAGLQVDKLVGLR